MDVDDCRVARGPAHEIDQRDVVDHRIGFRHHDESRDPAGCRGAACRGKRLAVFAAGFADMHARIDEAGEDVQPARIDHLGAIGRAGRPAAAMHRG